MSSSSTPASCNPRSCAVNRCAGRYVKALREVCGLDLRRPCNVRSMAASIKPRVLEAREMDVADLPSWYRWPERARGVAA